MKEKKTQHCAPEEFPVIKRRQLHNGSVFAKAS
jgi:hypothetical protein